MNNVFFQRKADCTMYIRFDASVRIDGIALEALENTRLFE